MKKTILYIFTLLAVSTAFFACEDPYANQEVAKPTVFDQPAIQSADFKAEVKANPLVIVADKLTATVPFISLTSVPTLVDDKAMVEYKVILSNSADFAISKSIAATLTGKDLVASYKQLNDTLKALNPTVAKHPAFARVLAYIVKGGTKVLYTTQNVPFDVTTYNYPPMAKDDIVVVIKDEEMSPIDVLANDSDPEGNTISFADPAIKTQPEHGTLMVSGKSIFYTPASGYVGADKFQYTITDGYSTASAWVNITVTAMKQYFETTVKPWFIVGSMGGWANSMNDIGNSLIPLSVVEGYKYDAAGNGEFTYTGYFKASDEFIIVKEPGTWAKWANNGGKGINSPALEGSDNFKVPADGYYTIKLNSVNNTMTIVPATVIPTTDYTSTPLEMRGSWDNSWGVPLAMTQNTNNKHIWYMTHTFNNDYQGKFKLSTTWDTNWGSSKFPVGIGTNGGDNISIKAGTYAVIINDIDGCYYFIKK